VAIEAGALRHRVTFQDRIETQDATTGGLTTVWRDLFTDVPAAVEPLSAREFISAQALQSKVIARITVRYRAGLSAAQRIVHGSKIYNPEGIIPDKDSGLEYVTIPCSEGVNEG
jgi:SPP1 family predicted phage head-tail adaptor